MPVSDLFGVTGRDLLARFELPQAWRQTTTATLETIDHLDAQISECEHQLRHAGQADPDRRLLQTVPGIGPILGFTIATEIGDITRFPTPKHLVGYTGLCPRVHQSGDSDWRGPLTKHGPRWLRWALIEATTWASQHPAYPSGTRTSAAVSAANADPQSPASTAPASSPPPSGGCSPANKPSSRQAPPPLWSPDDPPLSWATGSLPTPNPPPRRR